jgi:hypothetical protein
MADTVWQNQFGGWASSAEVCVHRTTPREGKTKKRFRIAFSAAMLTGFLMVGRRVAPVEIAQVASAVRPCWLCQVPAATLPAPQEGPVISSNTTGDSPASSFWHQI